MILPLKAFKERPRGLEEKSPRPSPPTCAILNEGIKGGKGLS
jgi:hypothetical protein